MTRLKKNIALSESGFVFDPSTGNSFTTNKVGMEVISMMAKGKSLEEIRTHICDEFETEAATVEKDLDDFVRTLKRMQIVEADA